MTGQHGAYVKSFRFAGRQNGFKARVMRVVIEIERVKKQLVFGNGTIGVSGRIQNKTAGRKRIAVFGRYEFSAAAKRIKQTAVARLDKKAVGQIGGFGGIADKPGRELRIA